MIIVDILIQKDIKAGDALEFVCPTSGYPKHYALFLGFGTNGPRFIANMMKGIQIIEGQELLDQVGKYEITEVERFKGNWIQRRKILKRALKRLGERSYNLIFNNCEHFKNWVVNGKSESRQVERAGFWMFLIAILFMWAGCKSKRKWLFWTGVVVFCIPVVIGVYAWFLFKNNSS